MKIAQNEWGHVFLFESKNKYSNKPILFQYKESVQLEITFEKAVHNKQLLKKAFPLLGKVEFCSGETVKEIKV
jgi:hypothetical protein